MLGMIMIEVNEEEISDVIFMLICFMIINRNTFVQLPFVKYFFSLKCHLIAQTILTTGNKKNINL